MQKHALKQNYTVLNRAEGLFFSSFSLSGRISDIEKFLLGKFFQTFQISFINELRNLIAF